MKIAVRARFLIAAVAALTAVLVVFNGAGLAATADEETVDLSVTIGAPEHVAPGQNYTANLAYANLGTAASPGDTWVAADLPDGVEFVSAADQAGEPLPPDSVEAGRLTWQVGALPAGSCCRHIWITLAVADDLPESQALELQAEIGSSAVETLTENNTASDTSLVCDMAGSTKQAQVGPVQPGDVITYTFQLRLAQRKGPSAVQQRQVTLEDSLLFQHHLRFLGWVGPNTGEWDGHTLRWQGMVQAGEALTLQFRAGVEADTPPGTVIRNTARLSWNEMEMPLGPAETTVTLSEDARMIGPAGYTWQHANGVTLVVPPGAVAQTTRFQFRPLFGTEPPAETPAGYRFAHQAFELSAFQFGELHQFEQPIQLTLRLQARQMAGVQHESLRLWYRSGPGEPWAMLGEPTWLSEDTLSFSTNHFTEFALFGLAQDYQVHIPLVVR